MKPSQRSTLIAPYAAGPSALRAAYLEAIPEAVSWKPAPDDWSIHQIIVHCADSEAYAAIRFVCLWQSHYQ